MNKFMQEAIKEAEMGIKNAHGGPFGAVIVKKGRIVGRGHNTVVKENDATCHAEIQAIRNASKTLKSFDLNGCILYTTGRPCPMCKAALKWAKISKVYYGCTYADAKSIGFDEMSGNSKNYTEKQIERKSCKELYTEFTIKKGKIY